MYKQWYKNLTVQYEIVNALRGKYLTVLSDTLNIDFISIRSIKDLNFYLDKYDLCNGKYNFYYTVNNYTWLNFFDLRFDIRKNQYIQFRTGICIDLLDKHRIQKTHKDTCKSRDMVFDFDAHGEKGLLTSNAFKELLTLIKYYQDKKEMFYVKMSGSGWHITIPNKILEWNERTKEKSILKEVCSIFDFRSLDKQVYNEFQIMKCPYSIDRKTGNVVLPVDMNDICDIESYYYKDIMDSKNLFKRGLKLW